MTQGRYYWMTLVKACGVKIAQRCLVNATQEMHLFKDAQELIGFYNSDYVESIDELKTEYWEIKNLKAQIEELEEKEEKVQDLLENSMSRHGEISSHENEDAALIKDSIELSLNEREELLEQRTEIFNQGKAVRKIYDGLKTKLEYQMRNQSTPQDEILQTQERLRECSADLRGLKGNRDEVANLIEEVDLRIKANEDELKDLKKFSQNEAFESSSNLGDLNRELALIRGSKQTLVNTLNKNVRYVGRFLFANRQDKEVAQCIKKHKELVNQAKVLRKSVILNHRLVDNKVEMSSSGD